MPKTKPKPIAPIDKRPDGKWWVDTSEIHGAGEVYGPYEAEEDRAPLAERIKIRRQLKITSYDPACELSAADLKMAIKLLGKMTKGSMRLSRLDPDQRKVLGLLLYKYKGPGSLGEGTLADQDTLKRLFYYEARIDPDWPEAEHYFIQWAISFAKDKPA
jgi:hypothetical protein